MKIIVYLVLMLSLLMACTPTRTLMDVSSNQSQSDFNTLIEGKLITLRLDNRTYIKPKKATLISDSLAYIYKNKEHIIPLSEVKSITVSSRFSVTNIISIPLITLGAFGVTSFDSSGAIGPNLGKAYIGTMAMVAGFVIYIFGSNRESNTYHFNED